jgi:hypothetical protein
VRCAPGPLPEEEERCTSAGRGSGRGTKGNLTFYGAVDANGPADDPAPVDMPGPAD